MPALSTLALLAAAALAPSLGAQPATHLVVVAGAAGEPRYGEQFHAAASAIVGAARERFGVPAANVAYLGDDPARAPGVIAARSTRENVQRALAAAAARARAGDQLWVVLIGHGSGEGEQSRFNLPGPDLTAADYRRALGRLTSQRVVFVNAASASGDFVRVLGGRNRVVVTATKSATERNETTFARHFAAALAAPGADVDKDGRVTLLEAFAYARREVARAYEQDNRLLTEHAMLDDDGDGTGTADPSARRGDGAVAATLALGRTAPGAVASPGGRAAATSRAPSSPAAARLAAERAALETRVAELRQRKETMDAAAYDRELERLLVDLARVSQALRAAGGGAP